MSVHEIAAAALKAGDLSEVRKLLEPLALKNDREAQTALGTYLTSTHAAFPEGIDWLQPAADAGYGHAAHNLASWLANGGPGMAADPERARVYMEVACSSGFEETVASDALWWRPKAESDANELPGGIRGSDTNPQARGSNGADRRFLISREIPAKQEVTRVGRMANPPVPAESADRRKRSPSAQLVGAL